MRVLLGILVGAGVGSLTLVMVGIVANAISPTPTALMDSSTPEAVARRVAAAPLGTWLTVIFGLVLGGFVGGGIGARVAKDRRVEVTTGIGTVLSLWALYTLYIVFPAVLWVPAIMLIVAFAFSYLGGLLARRTRAKGAVSAASSEASPPGRVGGGGPS